MSRAARRSASTSMRSSPGASSGSTVRSKSVFETWTNSPLIRTDCTGWVMTPARIGSARPSATATAAAASTPRRRTGRGSTRPPASDRSPVRSCGTGLQDPPDEIIEADPDRLRGHRHEGMARHPGRGVHVEEAGLAGGVADEVHPSPPRCPEYVERGSREPLESRLGGRVEAAGAVVLRAGSVGVFRLVVVELVRGLEPDQRKPGIAQDGRVYSGPLRNGSAMTSSSKRSASNQARCSDSSSWTFDTPMVDPSCTGFTTSG